MMTWFDNVKTHVGWDKADRTQIAELRRWLDSDATGVIEGLGKQLAQFKGTQSLMANARVSSGACTACSMNGWWVCLMERSTGSTSRSVVHLDGSWWRLIWHSRTSSYWRD